MTEVPMRLLHLAPNPSVERTAGAAAHLEQRSAAHGRTSYLEEELKWQQHL
jgi:hypothetical protein